MNPEELKTIAVLQGLDGQRLASLATVLKEEEFADDSRIFIEGGPGDSMYFIVKGRVRIEKGVGPDMVSKTLTVLEPGDYFGEMALLDGKPRSASAMASGATSVLCLPKAAFDELQRNTDTALNLLFSMIRTSGDRIRRLSAHLVVYDEVGKAIGEAQDLDQLLNVILQQLATASSADWGLIVLRSQFSERLEIRSQLNLVLTDEQREIVASGQGFLEPALRTSQEQLVDNIAEQEPFKSRSRVGFETPSMLLAPISCKGDELGLIVLGGRNQAQFDLDALNLSRGVARQAAQAILNARHREEEQARLRHARQYVRF